MAIRGKAYEPTETQRIIVSVLVECGIPHKVIAAHRLINCTFKTFVKAYAREIADAKAIANQEIILSAYQQAKSGKVPAMTMFWLKCRCGWREKDDTRENNASEVARAIAEVFKAAGPNR